MNFQEVVNRAKELLRQSMVQTLKFMVPLINPESEIFDVLVQVEGRYNQTEGEFNQGIIDSQERDLRLNNIRASILSTINQLKESDVKSAAGQVTSGQGDAGDTLLEKLRESIAEVERLKAENQILKNLDKKHKLKIIVQCEPEIDDRPNNYSCQCIILDDETGEEIEKEIPLRKEPGGIIATIHDINPSDYIQIKIKNHDKVWESEYFSPQFLTQILRLV